MWWLLEASILAIMERAHSTLSAFSAEQITAFMHQPGASAEDSDNRLLSVAGNTAQISIKGVLTKEPDMMAMFFGGGNTTYAEINSALMAAEQDPAIDKVILKIDSPGGMIAGLYDTLGLLQSMKTVVESEINDLVASAAYALAANTSKITVNNRAARIGSIGTMMQFRVDEDKVTITNTDSPKKHPDVTTDVGKAMVREELDDLQELFVETVALGRGVPEKTVIKDFGQGGVFLAEEALSRGMIDAIEGTSTVNSSAGSTVAKSDNNNNINSRIDGGEKTEEDSMDLAKLKAEHPGVHAAAVAEGVASGIAQEKDRVSAHLTMGSASGAMETAIKAINDGDGLTASHQASYMAASMNKNTVVAKGEDNVVTDDVLKGAGGEGKDDKGDASAQVLSIVENSLGIDPK